MVFHKKLITTLYLFLALVFLYAGISKIKDPLLFIQQVKAYQILPSLMVVPFALSLPFLEVLTVLGSLKSSSKLASLLSYFLMSTSFLIALLYAKINDLNIDCGCFGDDSKITWSKIIFDSFLILIIIFLTYYEINKNANEKISKANG